MHPLWGSASGSLKPSPSPRRPTGSLRFLRPEMLLSHPHLAVKGLVSPDLRSLRPARVNLF